MIVRKKEDHFYLFPQHHHALVSGEFASNFQKPIRPLLSTLYAISHHDVAWINLDREVLWNEQTNQPYSFDNYPLEKKLFAYRQGIQIVEAKSAYAGYLCSKHYAQFFTNDHTPIAQEFRKQERVRQHKLREYFTLQEEENLVDNYRLLRFCDDLSLSLCLNEPMKTDHPWFRDGILFLDETYQWIWEDSTTIRLSPNPFQRDFVITLPYQVYDQNRNCVANGKYEWTVLGKN